MITVDREGFSWIRPVQGLEVIPAAGTAIARNGGRTLLTPYDDTVLIMPSRDPKPGTTAVRLARIRIA
ncbi:MAG: hypothetical protein RMK02_02415 [Burkholderiales bacterium]|nr:hypothetical protein [Burkholderiales bacterium]